MDKLPEVKPGMPIDQYAVVEILSVFVEVGTLTMDQAVERYEKRRAQVGSIDWQRYEQ